MLTDLRGIHEACIFEKPENRGGIVIAESVMRMEPWEMCPAPFRIPAAEVQKMQAAVGSQYPPDFP